MSWKTTTVVLLLSLQGFFRWSWRRKLADGAEPVDAAPQAAASEPEVDATGRVRIILQAELRGEAGTFATKWQAVTPYRIVVEVADLRRGATDSHMLAEGQLGFWRGGRNLTIHDSGYALGEDDWVPIYDRLLVLVDGLRVRGWDLQPLDEVLAQLEASAFIIRLRAFDRPYDSEPRPGRFDYIVLDLRLP